jgi:hypothetical protein
MRKLERRLLALEAERSPSGCLECELHRLNRHVGARSQPIEEACSHRPGLMLVDALRALDLGGQQ